MSEKSMATRFPVNRQNHTKKGSYLTPILRKFLNKKISYIDPETLKKIRGNVKDAVLWRLILNATEGETQAAKEILDRIDGKVTTPIEHSGEVNIHNFKDFVDDAYRNNGKAIKLPDGKEDTSRLPS